MAERDQMGGDTVDAAICTATGDRPMIKAESEEQNRNNDCVDGGSMPWFMRHLRQSLFLSWRYEDFESKGVCMIINNMEFTNKALATRYGTDKDEDAVERTFKSLQYKVIVHKNLTKKEMEAKLKHVSTMDHRRNTSFVCVILSHGNEDGIYGTDTILTLNDLTFHFKGDQCKSLIGKPKLFFLQACRGEKMDYGVSFGDVLDSTSPPTPKKIPVEADFLYAYATAPGHYAWRNENQGTWFIQTLCDMLSRYSHLELMQIMTRVNNIVAYDYWSEKDQREIPCITSMLTKEFYFTLPKCEI